MNCVCRLSVSNSKIQRMFLPRPVSIAKDRRPRMLPLTCRPLGVVFCVLAWHDSKDQEQRDVLVKGPGAAVDPRTTSPRLHWVALECVAQPVSRLLSRSLFGSCRPHIFNSQRVFKSLGSTLDECAHWLASFPMSHFTLFIHVHQLEKSMCKNFALHPILPDDAFMSLPRRVVGLARILHRSVQGTR